MGLFGIWVIGTVVWHAAARDGAILGDHGRRGHRRPDRERSLPRAPYAWRDGDANMRSVWICSRNDVIANVAVLAAALGVFGTGTGLPDLMVAAVMAIPRSTAPRPSSARLRRLARPRHPARQSRSTLICRRAAPEAPPRGREAVHALPEGLDHLVHHRLEALAQRADLAVAPRISSERSIARKSSRRRHCE